MRLICQNNLVFFSSIFTQSADTRNLDFWFFDQAGKLVVPEKHLPSHFCLALNKIQPHTHTHKIYPVPYFFPFSPSELLSVYWNLTCDDDDDDGYASVGRLGAVTIKAHWFSFFFHNNIVWIVRTRHHEKM